MQLDGGKAPSRFRFGMFWRAHIVVDTGGDMDISSRVGTDFRLSGVLHMLLHMAEADGPITSEDMAKASGSNPAVVRRALAGLRRVGIVRSKSGYGGG
jgi:hypothetical protein